MMTDNYGERIAIAVETQAIALKHIANTINAWDVTIHEMMLAIVELTMELSTIAKQMKK